MCKQIKRLTELSQCHHLNKTDRDSINWAIYQIQPPEVLPEKGFDGFDFSSWPSVPDKKLIDDWSKTRKSKGKPIITQSFIESCTNHLLYLKEKNISVNQAVAIAANSGWQGFKCNWVIKEIEENKIFTGSSLELPNTPAGWVKRVQKKMVTHRNQIPLEHRKMIDTSYLLGKYDAEIMEILTRIGFAV